MNQPKRFFLMTMMTFALSGAPVPAAVLQNVPMQGPMIHVGIEYATHGSPHLHIHIEPGIPVLQPLSLSHPGDTFDPLDPWYTDLDPTQSGRAFNRQYGFVLEGTSDPLPSGYGIWIRQLSLSFGMEVFRYRQSPELWQPIFGTHGSSDTLQWNLGMFHPAYTAPAGIGTYYGLYEAFVVDEDGNPTGVSEQFQLQWTAIPEPSAVALTLLGLGLTARAVQRRRGRT
jgi:hypothetical protein